MAKRINMELRVKDKGTPVIKRFSEKTRSLMMSLAGPLAVGAVVAGFTTLLKKTVDYGDKLHKLNLQLGISVTNLDKLKRVGDLAGVSLTQITTAIRFMSKGLKDATDGTGLAKDALEELGLEAGTLIDLKPDEAFLRIGEALEKVVNPTRRNALAMELYGRSGTVITQMLKDLRGELDNTKTAWNQQRATQSALLKDEMTNLKTAFEDLAIEVIPALVEAVKVLIKSWKVYQGILDDIYGSTDDVFVQQIENYKKRLGELQRQLVKSLQLIDKINETKGPLDDTVDPSTHPEILALRQKIRLIKESIALAEKENLKRGRKASGEKIQPDKPKATTGAGAGADSKKVLDVDKLKEELENYFNEVDQAYLDLIDAQEENERALNEARSEGWLESARMAEEALNAEIEMMNAETEKIKAIEAQLTKDLDEEWKRRQKAVEEYTDLFSNNMINAFGDFADGTKDLKDSFSDMITSLASDLQRLLISQAFNKFAELFLGSAVGGKPSAGGTGGFLSSIVGMFGGLAGGGTAKGGKPVVVGERGPELFIPGTTGTVVPNGSSGGSVQNNVTVNVSGDNKGSEADNQRFGRIIAEQVKDQIKLVIVDEQRYGGILNRRQY